MDASRLVPSWMRLVHRWYAEMTGDFWERCILCLREYGGHEWRAVPGAIPDPIRGVGHVITICRARTPAHLLFKLVEVGPHRPASRCARAAASPQPLWTPPRSWRTPVIEEEV